MVQRLIRLVGWCVYGLASFGAWIIIVDVIRDGLSKAISNDIMGIVAVLATFAVGRGIIYVAVGPRRNPF